MDFARDFEKRFIVSPNYDEGEVVLRKSLQDTQTALQESLSEVDQLKKLIEQLYSEARVENVATGELLAEMKHVPFRNVPLPRNADGLSANEKAGYVVYYMKFLGFATRKMSEEHHVTKEHLDGMHKSIKTHTSEVKVPRSGALKIPDLDGDKEMKRGDKPTAPVPSPTTAHSDQKKTKNK